MLFQIIGTVTGILNVWLMAKQNVWCWPAGLIYIFASYVVFFEAKLYAELFSHTAYLVLTIYGWYVWSHPKHKENPIPISGLNLMQMVWLLILNAIASGILGFLLSRFTDNVFPYLDATLAMLSFTAMALQAHKKIESWHLWGLINAISVGLYLSRHLYFYAGLYFLFLILSVTGFWEWKRKPSHS